MPLWSRCCRTGSSVGAPRRTSTARGHEPDGSLKFVPWSRPEAMHVIQENLFVTRKTLDYVPADHPLVPIRRSTTDALWRQQAAWRHDPAGQAAWPQQGRRCVQADHARGYLRRLPSRLAAKGVMAGRGWMRGLARFDPRLQRIESERKPKPTRFDSLLLTHPKSYYHEEPKDLEGPQFQRTTNG